MGEVSLIGHVDTHEVGHVGWGGGVRLHINFTAHLCGLEPAVHVLDAGDLLTDHGAIETHFTPC